ncbi:MAG: hypothetical protein JNL88_00860 [Bacteroidia bacterium]|nr:hypothetical protein [Bacteroidia bacterium]
MIFNAKVVSCPRCGNRMEFAGCEKENQRVDKLSFGLLQVKQYLCYSCLNMKRVLSRSRGARVQKRLFEIR